MKRRMSAIGTKRTCRFALHMSAYDPKRTCDAAISVRSMLPVGLSITDVR